MGFGYCDLVRCRLPVFPLLVEEVRDLVSKYVYCDAESYE